MAKVHRTAIFAIHDPTGHVTAVLWRALKYYTIAYTELLHACEKAYTVDELRWMAKIGLDDRTGKPRMSSRALAKKLYEHPGVRRCLDGVGIALENRLRQSVRENVAQSILSYVVLYDRWLADPSVGGRPAFPHRLRLHEVDQVRRRALEEIPYCFDVLPQRLNRLAADLQRTQQARYVSVPFVGVSSQYGLGLYYEPDKRKFLARLDVVGSQSRFGRAITRKGRFIDIRTGVVYKAGKSNAEGLSDGTTVFGRTRKSILVPLALGRWHEQSKLPLTNTAFLPQREIDPRKPEPAIPVSGKLVYREKAGRTDSYRLELHLSFEMPRSDASDASAEEVSAGKRPVLAINRGIRSLYAAVVTDADGLHALEMSQASGDTLLKIQVELERRRSMLQQRGVAPTKRDRKQSQIAHHHINLCANQVVEIAMRHKAQVIFEDLASFASGYAVRSTKKEVKPAARGRALRALLNRRQFEAFLQAVDQRLELAGLPRVRLVSSAYISQTCPACGHRSSENKHPEDLRLFRCEKCTATLDLDRAAAMNIARKLGWLRIRQVQKKAEVPTDQRLSWDDYASQHPVDWGDLLVAGWSSVAWNLQDSAGEGPRR